MKKETLVTTLQERPLMWYIKYCTDNPMAALEDIQTVLTKEFSRPKYEEKPIDGFKEIMMNPGKPP